MKSIFKKTAALVLGACAVFTTASYAASCASGDDGETTIVCTIFPQYDWVREILGDEAENFNLVLLTESGTDLHNYQASANDIKTLKYAELFIYVGGESDDWVEDTITSSKTSAITISMIDEVDAVEEEFKEGMTEEDEEHDHDDSEEETEYDEHVWLSLKNAQTLVSVIAEKICEIDPENAATYRENAVAYNAELSALDGQYKAVVDSATYNTLLFADRFPFIYMVNDYGLDYYAAFKGCSSNETATMSTLKYLAQKVIDLDLKHVIAIETTDTSSSSSTARQVLSYVDSLGGDSSGIDILVLNSCQSITASSVTAGTTYLSIMKDNLEVLEQALN